VGRTRRERLTRLLQGTLRDAEIEERALDLCAGIRLYLISPGNMNRVFSPEEVRSILRKTPYWAFCWSAGHALAAYLLSHPEMCRGKRVVDFGAGSGVASIAAALGGAREVCACDNDMDALAAVRANAALNGVSISTCARLEELPWAPDLILAADAFYDPGNLPLLGAFLELAERVLVADARVKNLGRPEYRKVHEMEADTLPDLGEAEEFRRVGFYVSVKESSSPGVFPCRDAPGPGGSAGRSTRDS